MEEWNLLADVHKLPDDDNCTDHTINVFEYIHLKNTVKKGLFFVEIENTYIFLPQDLPVCTFFLFGPFCQMRLLTFL